MTEIEKALSDPARTGVQAYWDYGSRFYDETPGLLRNPENEAWKKMLSEALGTGCQSMLDVGTGTGFVAMLLAELGHQVTGVDFSSQMLGKAKQKASGKGLLIRFLEGDADSIPFETGAFEALTARYVLWTLAQPKAAIQEWIRVVKPGGRIVIIDGYWENRGLLQKLCRINIQIHRRLKYKQRPSAYKYNKDLCQLLPHPQGVHREEIGRYMIEAGLEDITSTDLEPIRRIQKQQAPWYLKYAYDYPSYLFSAKTPAHH